MTEEQLRELKDVYGEDSVVCSVGSWTVIMLDRPDAETIERRLSEFDPTSFLTDGCPLCQLLAREGGEIVYDQTEVTTGRKRLSPVKREAK